MRYLGVIDAKATSWAITIINTVAARDIYIDIYEEIFD